MNSVKISHNQFRSQTIIEIAPKIKTASTKLSIFDILGHEVTTAFFGSDNKVILGKDNISNGVYFYRIFQKEKLRFMSLF
jgi:hypothetical protein